ncbi:hypothetical protein BU25DRAFT_487400 [Macroventuria anomochaeta]|uniref:Uncharacterized protein n=1 Tax=Macroventuria anomochaeta TaxID=301207 RepID=A0ACB6SI77_9PLEO|nr:uncharacterized protein BU25DRAFT_487400 [Macroventuria anomochaeta]KAF2633053.1 hypothetical protein BU25DRAFT_487400 [Macroventuria anomochaeta]
MDNHLPFGYTHRQKRSHDQMEGNAGSAWSLENLTPFTRLGVPREHSLPQPQEPFHANRRGSSSQPNYYAASGHRARTPDAAMRAQYSASREPTAQPNDRPASAGTANPSVGRHLPHIERPAQNMEYGQVPRFEGDGFDMRRPVGWQSRGEGHGRAEERHPVEISDGEDDEPIVVHEDGDDIAAYHAQAEAGEHDQEEVVDLTEDDTPGYARLPQNDRQAHNNNRARSQPTGAGRSLNNDAARLPRGMAGIINLDNGEEAWAVDDDPVILEPSSPDIQFVSARRLDPPNRLAPPPRRNDSDGDDVQFVEERPLSENERRARQHAARHAELDRVIAVLGNHRHDRYSFAHLRGEIDRANAHIHHLAEHMRHGGPQPQPPPRLRRGNHIRMGVAGAGAGIFVAPNLNFGMVGFDMGYGGNRAEPAPPTYEAPAPAPEGFTRSPEENDVLVCPNCDSELCKGDDDVKKQVWIAKQCGHIYCGECTANRLVKRSAKGKEKQAAPKTRPLKECVVEGCGKKVSSPKAMFQLFML